MKYQNVSEYRQTLILGGKKILLLPNDIIESKKELKHVFLERVSDDSEVTNINNRRTVNVHTLKSEIEELRTKSQKEVNEVSIQGQQVENINQRITNLEKAFEDFMNKVNKRMEMMKTAIMTVQEDMYDIKFDENGRVVQEDPDSDIKS
jgi:hypothetical protein